MKGTLIYSLRNFNIILWLSFAGRSFCSLQKCSDGSCCGRLEGLFNLSNNFDARVRWRVWVMYPPVYGGTGMELQKLECPLLCCTSSFSSPSSPSSPALLTGWWRSSSVNLSFGSSIRSSTSSRLQVREFSSFKITCNCHDDLFLGRRTEIFWSHRQLL